MAKITEIDKILSERARFQIERLGAVNVIVIDWHTHTMYNIECDGTDEIAEIFGMSDMRLAEFIQSIK